MRFGILGGKRVASSLGFLLAVVGVSWFFLEKSAEEDTNMRSSLSENLELDDFSTISLRDAHFGYSQFRANDNESTVIDATNASWIVSNHGPRQNLYPFLIDGSLPGVRVFGGVIRGTVPIEKDWIDIYENSAAVMVRDAPQAEIRDWIISQAWDGIRVAGASDDFRIDNVEMFAIRDDAVENDFGASGRISNSMFDGVFSGISMSHNDLPDLKDNILTLDNVIIRMRSYPFKGNIAHQSPFKIVENSPSLKIFNSVIAIDNINHIGKSRLLLAWQKTRESSGNHFLNLSDHPLPDDYPLPGAGWTILQGPEAREYWDKAKTNWVSSHPAGAESRKILNLSNVARSIIATQ